MKEKKKNNYSLIISLIGIAFVVVFSITIATRISLIEQRYDLLLSNTMRLVDNISNVLNSLQADQVVTQLSSKVGVLRKENETLKVQVKNSKREIQIAAQKENRCQDQLRLISGQQKDIDREQAEEAGKEKAAVGNRGFLIKDGMSVKQ